MDKADVARTRIGAELSGSVIGLDERICTKGGFEMAADWERLLIAYLHDPPEKALGIHGHVARAGRYARAILGRDISDSEKKHLSDILASVAERLPARMALPNGQMAAWRAPRTPSQHPL